jgi:hypothetical protein
MIRFCLPNVRFGSIRSKKPETRSAFHEAGSGEKGLTMAITNRLSSLENLQFLDQNGLLGRRHYR